MHRLLRPFFLFILLFTSASAFATGTGALPEIGRRDWACGEIAELATKYGAMKRLPEKEVVEKKELVEALLDLQKTVRRKCELEGKGVVPREDLDRLAALHEALKDELGEYEGYQTLRDEIEAMLAGPEEPAFHYKLGINGFFRGEGAGNFRLSDYGYAPGHGEARFLYRAKPYAYWHPTDFLDIHAEGQGYGFTGGSHQEHHEYSLYQGFIEAKLPGSDLLALKGGRQEFSYGSTFILGPDSFYDGLSFDAVRIRVKPAEQLIVDLLAGAYATPFSGGVEGNLAGAYATYAISEGNAVEAYAFRDSGSTDHHAGEYLAIWGARLTGRKGPLSLELEPVYEAGRAFNNVRGANDHIDAFGGHFDLAAESILAGFNNTFFASYAYGSGARDAANGISAAREFRTPDNDNALVGDMGVIGDMSGITVQGHHASGLQIYTLGWGVDLTRELNFSATGRYFLANDVEHAFSRRLGLETDFTLTYKAAEGLSFIAGYDRFFTGAFFRDASGSGRDIDYGYLMVQFDLFHVKQKHRPAKG